MPIKSADVERRYRKLRRIFEDIYENQRYIADKQECMQFLTLVWGRLKQHRLFNEKYVEKFLEIMDKHEESD